MSVCVCVYLSVCVLICSLCTAIVLSGSGPNLAHGIVIPSEWSWGGLASAAGASAAASATDRAP